jgi:hypothetical protein
MSKAVVKHKNNIIVIEERKMVSTDLDALRRFVATLSVHDDISSPVDLPVSSGYSKSGVTSYSKSGVGGYSKSGMGSGFFLLDEDVETGTLSSVDSEADRQLLARLSSHRNGR